MSVSTVLRFHPKGKPHQEGYLSCGLFSASCCGSKWWTSHQVEFGDSPSSHRVVVPTLASHLLQYHTRRAGVEIAAHTRYQLNGVRKANPGLLPYCGRTAASDLMGSHAALSPRREAVRWAIEPLGSEHKSQWRLHRWRVRRAAGGKASGS